MKNTKDNIDKSHYFDRKYDDIKRFCSYWYQINEVLKLDPKKVLEIGIGNGFVSNYLRDRSINITTLDINEDLNPDIVGSVLDLPFGDNSFDVVTCYEVLEHMPYENFHTALSELYRVCKHYTLISLPHISRVLGFSLYLSKIGVIKKTVPLFVLGKIHSKIDKSHYWEIEQKEYPLRRIISDIQGVNFKILKTYRAFEQPYHRFFVLEKQLLKTKLIDI